MGAGGLGQQQSGECRARSPVTAMGCRDVTEGRVTKPAAHRAAAVLLCASSLLLSTALLSTVLFPSFAVAQVPPGGTGLTREQLDPTQRRVPETGGTTDTEATTVAPTPDGPSPDDAPGFKFELQGIVVDQATVFDQEDFLPAYEGYVGTQIGLGELREISDRIEQVYRENGYIAARVIVPPQTIENGTPTLTVFEGRIVHYEINGDIGPVKELVAAYLENLVTDRAAHFDDIERYLLLARDIPGISLTGTLRPAGDASPGGVVLVVDTALKQFDGFVSAENLSAEVTGPYVFSVGAAMNSLTKYGERTGAVMVFDPEFKEQVTAFISSEWRFGDEGFVLRFAATQSYSDPGDQLRQLNIKNWATIFTLEGEFPVVRSRELNFFVFGGFNYADVYSSLADSGQAVDDQLRTFYSGMRVIWRPPTDTILEARIEGRLGVSAFGASPENGSGVKGTVRSRTTGDSKYALVRGEASVAQGIGPWFTLWGRMVGQYSPQQLFSYEEFSLGHLTVGRGYDPGAVVGESGFGMQAELRYGHPAIRNEYVEDVEFFGFYDWARVWDRDFTTARFEELSSWGLGVRFRALDTVLAEFYAAIPLEPALSISADTPEPSVRFRVTKFF